MGKALEPSPNFKYLGVELSEDLAINMDVGRVTNSFLKQFNGIFSKFYYVDRNVLLYLVKSYTMSFYGIETWYDFRSTNVFHKASVAYHKGIKKTMGFDVWDSNHEACETARLPLFKHLYSKRLLSFALKLCSGPGKCLSKFKYVIRFDSILSWFLLDFFMEHYNVDVFKNDIDSYILESIIFNGQKSAVVMLQVSF